MTSTDIRPDEDPLDADIPVIDSHHYLFRVAEGHLCDVVGMRRFWVDDYMRAINDEHNVVASVYVGIQWLAPTETSNDLDLHPEGEPLKNGGRCRVAAASRAYL